MDDGKNNTEKLFANAIKVLGREDSLKWLFPDINLNNKTEKDYFLSEFFLSIKDVFQLINDDIENIIETCTITSNLKLSIKIDKSEDLLLSYTIALRYLIEYSIRVPYGFSTREYLRYIRFIRRSQLYFELMGQNVKSQLDIVVNEYSEYIYSGIFLELNNDADNLNLRVNTLNEFKKDIDIKYDKIIAVDKKIDSFIGEMDGKIQGFNEKVKKELLERENKINELKGYLVNLSTDYNFVGLTMAYSRFYKSKSIERWISLAILLILAIVSLVPLGAKIMLDSATRIEDVNLVHYIGFSALTIICLYFFRVSLQNYNSIKAELTQLKLRMNLCMFIENYSNFAKNHGEQSSLEKFENIIFSNIQMNENNIPSTFDGLEQLASLINSLTSKDKK